MRKIGGRGQQRQRFEIGFLPLSLCLGYGERAVEQPHELAWITASCPEDAEVKLVVGDDVEKRTCADEAAGGAQMRHLGVCAGRDIEVADFLERDHSKPSMRRTFPCGSRYRFRNQRRSQSHAQV